MTDAIAILGQSNGDHFWATASSGLTPASGTYMWDATTSAWIAPVNSLIAFCNELKTQTNRIVYVLPGAVGGSSLLASAAASDAPSNYWLNKASSTSPLVKFLAMLSTSAVNLRAVWWIHGEAECGAGSSMEQYLSGLIELHAIIAGACGKTPADLPFVVSPVGAAEHANTYGRRVLQAQVMASRFPGFVLGPDYYDLTTYDGTHLDETSRSTFAIRGARALLPYLDKEPAPYSGSSTLQAKVVSFDVDLSTTGNQNGPSIGFQPKAIIFLSGQGATGSIGFDDAVAHESRYDNNGGAGLTGPYSNSITLLTGAGNYWHAFVSSVNSDGFSLTKAKSGSPTGTYTVKALCLG